MNRFAPLPIGLLALLALLALLGPRSGFAEDTPTAPAPDRAAPSTPAKPIDAPPAEPPPVNTDPREGEAPLPATSSWHASLVLDNKGVGVWTVKSYDFLDHLACPEVIGLDDKGHCNVLMPYSGRWKPIRVLHDGSWLGGLTHGDVDPRVKGTEVYTGSQRGNLYQVRRYGHTLVDGRLIGRIEGREIHTLVAGDLDPRTPGHEVLVFTRPGGLYRLTPDGEHGGFTLTKLMDLKGRVRDAVVLPAKEGTTPSIATVARTGRLELLTITREGPRWRTIYRASMGKGRIALRPGSTAVSSVLYTTHDDGRIVRHERMADGDWRHVTIYLGPQGPRGIAAGPFGADPATETVAIFGYSRRVELLTRGERGWTVETLFEDLDKGHWLCAAELDGRNGTRELVLSGYSGRIVLLARPPGYGRTELAARR